jgi:hypothetical protein
MVMSAAEPGTKSDCSSERQQHFTRPDPRGSVQCSADSDEKLVIRCRADESVAIKLVHSVSDSASYDRFQFS